MIVLDENILDNQRQRLRSWRMQARQIGYDLGEKGMADDQIIPFLRQLRRPSFFTRDWDFYRREYCHNRYCLAILNVGRYEVAAFARRFLRHPDFNTQAKRMGAVIRVSSRGLSLWRIHSETELYFDWPSNGHP